MSNVDLHARLAEALAKADNNQSRFASDIGTSQQLVSYWMRKKRPLPPEFAIPAERAGYGARSFLRPDIYPEDDGHGASDNRAASPPSPGKSSGLTATQQSEAA